jgi:hypothetical protein
MSQARTIGFVLIAAGALCLVYGSFSVNQETQTAKLGPVQLTARERPTVNVPIWAGVGVILVGGMLLLYASSND